MRYFWLKKIHSLLGILPLGLFLCIHIFSSAFITVSPEAYQEQVAMWKGIPYHWIISLVLVGLPLLLHAVLGIYMMYSAKINLRQFPTAANASYTLQRFAGILSLLFIVYHVASLYLSSPDGATPAQHGRWATQIMAQELSKLPIFAFYVAGSLSVIFHFAYGLWTFGINWGITVSPNAQRVSKYCCWTVGLLMSAVTCHILWTFRTMGLS